VTRMPFLTNAIGVTVLIALTLLSVRGA
jgi:hypothetical protein